MAYLKAIGFLKNKFRFIKNNPWILLLWNELRRRKGMKNFYKLDDENFLKKMYKESFGLELDLDNPKRFNEKLQWIKLNYRHENMRICADKYEVRQYLRDKGYGYLLNDLITVYEDVGEINLNKLPDKFVLKASHGSGWNFICKNKQKVNWAAMKRVIKSWMKQDLYWYGREWHYHKMKPRIIIEKYLEDRQGELLDYKFFCFHGIAKMVQVSIKDGNEHRINLYDKSWIKCPYSWSYPTSKREVAKPKNLGEMFRIAESLASAELFVRIDLYNVDGKIYFGEMTYFPACGFAKFVPDEYDELIGKMIVLPTKM